MKKMISALLCALLALSLTVPALAEDTIKIGGLAPLTGGAAMYGISVQQGADLYIEKLNAAGGIDGKQVEILWDDDASDDTSVSLKLFYDKLDAGCCAILGPVLTPQCLVVSDAAQEEGVAMVTASGTDAKITQDKTTVFRTCFIDDFQGYVMANFAAEQGYKSVAILYGVDSAYSTGLVAAFEAQAAVRGLTVVAKEAANYSDIDFKTQLTNIKSANPDAVFLPFYGAEAALILTQAAEVGLETVYMGADGISNIVDAIADKSLLTQMHYSDHFAFDSTDEAVVTFKADFAAKYGAEPTISFSATGYDAALVICEAIKAAGSTDAAAIAEAIKGLTVEGVSGIISFDENNNPIKSAFVMTFDAEGNKHFVAKVDP